MISKGQRGPCDAADLGASLVGHTRLVMIGTSTGIDNGNRERDGRVVGNTSRCGGGGVAHS